MTKTYTLTIELPTKIFTLYGVPGSYTGIDIISFLRSKGQRIRGSINITAVLENEITLSEYNVPIDKEFSQVLIESKEQHTGPSNGDESQNPVKGEGKEKQYSLEGIDGNAFCIMGYVYEAMKECGYSEQERIKYFNEATKGDYEHLLAVSICKIDECNNH